MKRVIAGLAGLAGLAACTIATPPNGALRLDQIQVIGTHNSYHSGMSPVAMAWLSKVAPDQARELDYRHADLTTQLDRGVRQIELDLYLDREGDHYMSPRGPEWERASGLTPDAADIQGADMRGPDFKVMHIVDIDQHANCEPLRACLETVRAWSDAHPHHVPVFVLLETKESSGDARMAGRRLTRSEVLGPADYDRLDAELRDVFTEARLVTPDMVRGSHRTLEAAVRDHGWPLLDQVRGRMMFLFDQKHDNAPYRDGHPSLRGRVVFTNADPGEPDAAFVKRNDGPDDEIRHLVEAGYLVRTRADEGTREGRSGDTRRRDTAIASGAQIVSTDYPGFEPAPWTGYSVSLPGGVVARCDAVAIQGDWGGHDGPAGP